MLPFRQENLTNDQYTPSDPQRRPAIDAITNNMEVIAITMSLFMNPNTQKMTVPIMLISKQIK